MRATEFIVEGGWASVKTQGTVITPQVIANAVKILQTFNVQLNQFLKTKNLPDVKIGNPVGSGTYYQRDLEKQPTKEYGDVDIQFIIPRIEGLNQNQNQQVFFDAVKEFCEGSEFETENGKNLIFKVGNNYLQVDLVVIYTDTVDLSLMFAPEWNVKGVLSGSLYSALGEALHLSMNGAGLIQIKTVNGVAVKFATQKGTTLHTLPAKKETWGLDIVKFFGCANISPTLKQVPGMRGEVRIADIVTTIKGICETLELNDKGNASELLSKIKESYLNKINKVVTSSKFDKAATPEAQAKAEKTKAMLSAKSQEFAQLFGV